MTARCLKMHGGGGTYFVQYPKLLENLEVLVGSCQSDLEISIVPAFSNAFRKVGWEKFGGSCQSDLRVARFAKLFENIFQYTFLRVSESFGVCSKYAPPP